MHRVSAFYEIRDARACVRDVCEEHHLDGARCQDAELAVTELLGNALRHGRPPIELEVTWTDDGVLVTVADGQPMPPGNGGPPPATSESGRGMQLIDAVSRSWGCDEVPGGKRVWALL
jgi:anti-sigma regulatory factor (Ser/Thr protein kinase)